MGPVANPRNEPRPPWPAVRPTPLPLRVPAMTTPSTPAPPPPAVAAFLAVLRRSHLFSPEQLPQVEACIPASAATAAEAARALVAAGQLTRFQAERLLAGRAEGFVLGSYVILDQLGRGPLGRVYKARHRTMNRIVAVKVLALELTRTPEARQELLAEARVAARLNHPGIVTTFDANEQGDRFYLVREFVDGPNLETLVRDRGPLPVAEACELVRQAAEALAYAHGQGATHGDIRPANVLVTRPSKATAELLVKIADFGFARFHPSLAPPAPGTPPDAADYVAPELAIPPAQPDARTDLYGLGAVLYYLLTGRPLFPGGTAENKLRRLACEEPAPVELLRPEVPTALAQLVRQLLAKRPDERPANAAEVARRLEPFTATFAEVVPYDLPAYVAGPYSFVGSPLSARVTGPGGEMLPHATAIDPAATYPAVPALTPTVETQPWSALTAETHDLPVVVRVPTPRRVRTASGFSLGLTLAVVAGVVLLGALVTAVLIQTLGR